MYAINALSIVLRHNTCMLGILEKILQNLYLTDISNHNKVWRPRPKFKVSPAVSESMFYTQINFENI